MSTELRRALGPEGPLARVLDGYVPRPQQIEMAEVVEDVLMHEGWAYCDAPPGVGKSMGGLVPVALSGARTLYLTSSIALQEQLAKKDLPLLRRAFPKVTFAVVLGQSNYACLKQVREQEDAEDELEKYVRALDPTARGHLDPRRRILELAERGVPGAAAAAEQYGAAHGDELGRVLDWLETSDTGCLGDAPWQVTPEAWRVLTVGPGACRGRSCSENQDCFMQRAWRRAYRSQVVIANYHLFFTAAARALSRGADMPFGMFDLVICDEAHKMPDIARQCLGFRVTRRLVNYLCRFAPVEQKKASDIAARELFAQAWRATEPDGARDRRGSQRIYRPGAYDPARLCELLSEVVADYHEQANKVEDESRAVLLGNTAERIGYLKENLWSGARLDPSTWVYYVEGSEEWPTITAAEVDVGPSLFSVLSGYRRVVMTSATLATGGRDPFEHIRFETGVDRAAERPRVVESRVDSPFDHAGRCVVMIPRPQDPGVVPPDHADYREYVAELMVQLARAAGGRTLGLFTSWRGLEAARDRLRRAVDFPILVQGEDQRQALVQRFRDDPRAVLLGVQSMWTGIDVPGESCVAVLVDKIPFPNPREPVMEALSERDSGTFQRHMIPRAVAEMRQGVGRLIRSVDDFGVIVLPDTRLVLKGYGSQFLGALPAGMRVVRDMDAVAAHLAKFGIQPEQEGAGPWMQPQTPHEIDPYDEIPF